jgi:hypothetical protein
VSFVHPPKTDYQKMMLRAVVGKLEANVKPKGTSKRDEIRQYNSEHELQLPLRDRPGKASFYTHVTTKEGDRYLRETTSLSEPTEDLD